MWGAPPPVLMIISRTPLRVSFCGGGTDLDWFSNSESTGGMVTSAALDRHIHVTVNRRFDDMVRVSYSKMELVENFEDIEHELVRESMRMTGVTSGVEITTIADIPSRGTGLGSSSSVTVGLLNALHAYAGRSPSPRQLAEEACEIEIDILGQPIGRQDQYAAAYGGVNSISFGSEGTNVAPLEITEEATARISEEFTLVFTGITRSASEVLSETPEDPNDKTSRLREIRRHADVARDLLEGGDLMGLGELLRETWDLKRGISSSVSGDEIEQIHDQIMQTGATGSKLLGAGGGGFFLVHGGIEVRSGLEKLGLVTIPLEIDEDGSTIVHRG
ncbi:MAG: GHMP kinase [Candidatus Marinimicrobia bacterium]|nr:GHMP kinase [Candidatus Neomarinimicrobiota bacterium]